jgi:uncharacterized protein (TIRG00374 family)
MWAIALVVATSLLFVVFKNVDWTRVWLEVRRVQPLWLLAAVALNFAILLLWSLQWRVFLPRARRIKYSRMFETVAFMSTVTNSVPYMMGQASGVLLLAKRGEVGHTVALSVLALDQLAEGLAKISVLLVVALLIPIPPWLRHGILVLVAGVVSLLVILLWFAHRHREPAQRLERGRTSPWKAAAHFVSRWAHHLEALRSARVFGAGLVLALAMKLAEAGAILAIQRSFGIELPLWSVLLVLATVGLATMVAIVPGNLGVYEAAVFFVYQYAGASPEQALGLALIQHLCYLIPLAGTGYFLVLGKNLRRHERDQSLGRARLPDEA